MPAKSEKRKSTRKSKAGGDDADDFEAWVKSRQLAKPDDQLELTEVELNEEIPRLLTTKNPNCIYNLVVFSFKHREYIVVPPCSDIVTLFSFEGSTLQVDSAAAKAQIAEYGDEGYVYPMTKEQRGAIKAAAAPKKKVKRMDDDEEEDEKDEPPPPPPPVEVDDEGEGGGGEGGEATEGGEGGEGGEPAEGGEGGGGDAEGGGEGAAEGEKEGEVQEETKEKGAGDTAEEEPPPPVPSGRKRKLINQFNFCERAALTFTFPKRCVETETIPPPRSKFGANVLQWVLFDTYAKDFAIQQIEKEKEKKHVGGPKKEEKKKKVDKSLAIEELNKKYLKCWQILERMINQNIYDEIAQDYRYWEDPSDEYREGEGTLLPLWKFVYEKTKKMAVTELLFNPHYYDLYAVCFGSYDFTKQPSEGVLCFFSIKNPSFPDYIIGVESGVMCCDIHTKYPFLVAIGLYDGNVAVYNLQRDGTDPLYVSEGVNGKHAECVAQIKWAPDLPDGEINFFSVSTDGAVFNWVLMQNRLNVTKIITLFLDQAPVPGPDGSEMVLKSCGSCMTFHPTDPEIFLIGTEEGLIYKCSTAYSSKYLMTYLAHSLPVYRIDYNKFDSNIFASCSGDWRVKIWEDMRKEPLFIFDLGTNVGDVKWAPYSSTVFAAVTIEGKVFVFDLNVNKYRPICIQAVVPRRKNKLTRLEFNKKLPFIIVGDDKGQVISLKLSPNLRVMCKPPKKQQWLDQTTMQNQKLEKLLSLVREVPEGDNFEDDPSSAQS